MDYDAPRTEVYWSEDIRMILQGVSKAHHSLARHLPLHQVAIYNAGFDAALEAVADAIGVKLSLPRPQGQQFNMLPGNMRGGHE